MRSTLLALVPLVLVAACSDKATDAVAPVLPQTVGRVAIVGLSSDVLVNDSTTFTVRATDGAGNGIGNAALALSVTLGTLSPVTTTTDPDGTVKIKWRSGAVIGPATMTATATGSGATITAPSVVSKPITGRWYGQVGALGILSITITRHDVPLGQAFAGTASTTGFGQPQPDAVYGAASGTDVSMSVSLPGGTLSFLGTVTADGKTMNGQFTGGGFNHEAGQFVRAP
jgi:hypothetical protein